MAEDVFGHVFLVSGWHELALLISESDVRALVSMRDAMSAVEDAFTMQARGDAVNGSRRRIRYHGGVLHTMSGAVLGQQAAGIKTYLSTRRRTTFIVLLFNSLTGELLAILEADWLGRLRTGAASGVATKVLARADSRVAALIGTGSQAETQVLALVEARKLDEIRIQSRTRESREGFVQRMQGIVPCRMVAAENAIEAVVGADIVTTITTSARPVVEGAWLDEGTHVNAAGSNNHDRSEVDVDTVRRSACVVVDSIDQSREEAGDLLPAVEEGVLQWSDVRELADVVSGTAPGRQAPSDITLFSSLGVAVEDIALARIVYDRAVEKGYGEDVAFGGTPW